MGRLRGGSAGRGWRGRLIRWRRRRRTRLIGLVRGRRVAFIDLAFRRRARCGIRGRIRCLRVRWIRPGLGTRLAQSEAMAGGHRCPDAERHRERPDASDVFTAARDGDDQRCCHGKVGTLHIDAETWVGGLIAAGTAHLAVARFLPPITTARCAAKRSSPTAPRPDQDRFRSSVSPKRPRCHGAPRTTRTKPSFDGSSQPVQVPLAKIDADEETFATIFATKFAKSFRITLGGFSPGLVPPPANRHAGRPR
jgi:hypothetical protein